MNSTRRHLVYLYLLTECLRLKEHDRKEVEKAWGEYGTLIRSLPDDISRIVVIPEVARAFDYDLRNVPGFFYDYTVGYPMNWRINIHREHGLLRPYTNIRGRILGLYVYRSALDSRPRLLSSQGLCLGTQAIQPEVHVAA